MVEITVFRLERIFQPMRALKFITGHMVYNPAYTYMLQTTETFVCESSIARDYIAIRVSNNNESFEE